MEIRAVRKIRAVIVDDEPRARELLQNMLKENCPEVDILDCCGDLPNAVKSIRKLKPNLVFLDIEMPGHSGLDLLDFFNEEEINFSIIFTTAYQQYTLNAIRLSAFDYILKPIEAEELVRAVGRLKKKLDLQTKEQELSVIANKIAVPTSNGIRFINTESILYIKADNTYTEMFTDEGQKIVVSRTLKNFEDALSDFPNFFRCNKSYIINYKFVSEYVKSDGGYLVMSNRAELPISPDKVSDFIDLSRIVKR